jgi:hypothetical protein
MFMLQRGLIGVVVLIAALSAQIFSAAAFDDSKYPDFKGQWNRVGAPRWLQPGQKAPLTADYQAYYDAILKDQEEGGIGNWPSAYCIPQGMPAMMDLFDPMEIVVTPEITYILISHVNDSYRRIYTDGRDWPVEIEPTYAGYSIGKWVDDDGDGKYDALVVETRFFKGPRAFESTGLPLDKDNQTVIRERFYRDKTAADTLYDDITVFDHALTRPWTLHKKAERTQSARPVWVSDLCEENNSLVQIGDQTYFHDADGLLMPMKKNQPPPDLRYFKKAPSP